MKVSIITAVFNGAATIENCLKSIIGQSYKNIEHIIINDGSTDGTLDVVSRYKDNIAKVVSQPNSGTYNALNKGIGLSSGDIIGFLHADDFYAHNRVIENVVNIFKKENVDSCYGDLEYVNKENPGRVIRYWRAGRFCARKFRYGWMPPHPALFIKKVVYDKYGYFNTDFKIAADYELMLRFLLKQAISVQYLPEVLVKMRMGGMSNKSLKSLLIKSYEDYKAWKVNNLGGGISIVLLKNLIKIPQFMKRA